MCLHKGVIQCCQYKLVHYNYISTSAYIRMLQTSKSTIPAHIIEGLKFHKTQICLNRYSFSINIIKYFKKGKVLMDELH